MSELMFNFLIITGILTALLSFYDAFRVQIYRGVSENSKISALFVLLMFIFQTFLQGLVTFEDNPNVLIIIIVIAVLVITSVKGYVNGRLIMIHETPKSAVIERVRKQLQYYSIYFTEEEREYTDEFFFHLEENVVIKISSSGMWNESKNCRLSFKKWWKLTNYQDIKENIIQQYRQEREERIFWKEILLNIGYGLLTILIFYYLIQNVT